MSSIDLSPQDSAGPPPPSGTVTIRLSGEIDISTGPAQRELLLRALQEGPPRTLVVDLSDVSFCDAFGLGVLVGVRNQAAALGVAVALAAPRPFLAKLLRITGLDRVFIMTAEPPDDPYPPPPPEPAMDPQPTA